MNPIIRNYSEFDSFLEKVNDIKYSRKILYHALYSVRTLYSISNFGQQVGFFRKVKTVAKIMIALVKALATKRSLSAYGNAIVLGKSVQDKMVSERINLPSVIVTTEYNYESFSKNLHIIWDIVQIIIFSIQSNLNKFYFLIFIPSIINFMTIYEKIDFKNITTIITENDVLVEEYAIIASAKQKNIRTIKVDYFMVDDIYLNTINCNFYFYPNDYHKTLLEKFHTNKNVTFIPGGYPNWDVLESFKHEDMNESKKILYLTQHSIVADIQIKYITDILKAINHLDGYILVIKVHPKDKTDYSAFSCANVNIVYGDGLANYSLISQAFANFSMFSVLTLEAKHICENSFFINYDIEHSNYPINYNIFEGYIDIVKSKEMLADILEGRYRTADREAFIKKFNPSFPHSSAKLKELLV